jgi:hypothetical protein
VAKGGVLAAVAVVVLLVVVWALRSPARKRAKQPPQARPARPAAASGGTAAPNDATSPLARPVLNGHAGPRRTSEPGRPPKISGDPPWGPAPKPPGQPPADWLSRLRRTG